MHEIVARARFQIKIAEKNKGFRSTFGNLFLSIHLFQVIHVHSFISHCSFQFICFNSFISIPSFQCIRLNSCVSLPSSLSSFISLDSRQFNHVMHFISFQLTSFQPSKNSYNYPCSFFETSAPARAGHYLVTLYKLLTS